MHLYTSSRLTAPTVAQSRPHEFHVAVDLGVSMADSDWTPSAGYCTQGRKAPRRACAVPRRYAGASVPRLQLV